VGLYNFQKRFVEYIELGLTDPDHPHAKLHTIRARRKHEDKPGSTMHLYVGLRHKGARLIAEVPCVAVRDILIDVGGAINVDGEHLSYSEAEQLALHDGFPDGHAQMMDFWRREHFAKTGEAAFLGRVYHWGRP
jgi:hypothetical protein